MSKSLPIDKRLFREKNNQLTILSRVKNNTLSDFQKEIKKAYKHPITKAYILGKHKPKSYSELRESRPSYFSNNLEGEIAWILEGIKMCKNDLKRFIQLEKKVQDAILIGDNLRAKEILDEIDNSVCFSYWSLEVRYFLIEKLEGTEGNWKFSSQINNSTTNSYTLLFNQILSKKVEQGVSCSDYHRSFHNEIRTAGLHDFEYLNFKLAYHLLRDYNQYTFLIYADSPSSIIDRYISLLNIIAELLSTDEEENISIAQKVIKELVLFEDDRVERFMEYCGLKEISYVDNEYYRILENYTIGKYKECINDIPKILEISPTLIELWEIYVKSLTESSSKYVPTNISEHLDDLIKKLYVTYTIEDDSIQKADELLKFILSLPSFSFSKQLLSLIGTSLGVISKKNVVNNNLCFHSKITNPIILLQSKWVHCDIEFENLITSQCIKLIAGHKVDEKIVQTKISEFKFNLYQLRKAYKKNDYNVCIQIGESFEIETIRNNIFIEEIIYVLFQSYYQTNRFDDAIQIFVSSYFKNKNLVNKIDPSFLIDTIIDLNYPIKGSVDSAIFFNLNNLDNYHCFVSIEMWLESLDIDRPSEIKLPDSETELTKFMFILEHGCTIEVLEKFYYLYDSKDDVIDERKKILSILIQNENLNSDRFINELSTINQKEKVQSILQEVNSGRIRLTENMLDSSSENNFQNSYNRYLLLSEFSDSYDLEGYDSKKLLKNFLDSVIDSKSVATSPSFLSFKSLVNELVDGFLFNKKNGLDGELSTRIRHGEFENQMRSVFDRKHLISKKDDSGNYTEIPFWYDLLDANIDNEHDKARIQTIFKEFSQKIDSIIQYLVNEYIQVKSENYPNKKYAVFNYHFTENYMKLLFDDSKVTNDSFEKFIEYIYSILKVHTESHLKALSDYLVNKLRKTIDDELNKLREAILEISKDLVELNQNIIDAKVEFQNEILDISNWFVIADSTIDTTMDVKTIIDCSFESSNIQHPNTIITPVVDADEKLFIYNYKHYIFILLNLIENIRLYHKLPHSELKVYVSVKYEQDRLLFSVKNNFNQEQIDREELTITFEKIKNNWNKEVDQEYVNRERGSGYEKIKKILNYDIKSRNNSFDYKLEEETLEVIFAVEISFNYEIDG